MKTFLVVIGFLIVVIMLSHISDSLDEIKEGLAAFAIARMGQ
jgi:hypothetical protein